MKFFRKHQKKIISILAGIMALLMILPLLATIAGTASATKTDEIKSEIGGLNSEYDKINSQRKDIAAQLKEIRNDKSKAVRQKELVENEIDLIRSQIDTSNQLIAQYDGLIEQKETELVEVQAKEKMQFDLFCQRIRAMEKNGNASYLAVIFNASSFADLLDRITFINQVAEYDNAVMDALAQTRQEITEVKAEMETSREEQKLLRAEQMEQETELEGKLAEADALVSEIAAKEDEAEAAEAALKAAANALDKEIADLQKEYDRLIREGQIVINTGSGYQWPLSGYNTLSSLFGYRIHPVTGKPGNHTGIDIPAPKNTKILAARGGVVMTSKMGKGSDWSYGNYVVINHGDGTSTLYAHMNSRAVKQGDVVNQGQVIGYVGTTGRSTGNHLHYEVRVNGTRVDPVDYYPGMTLYARSGGKTVLLKH